MASVPKSHDRRRAEVAETLAELYLRLNGYFCVRNYLQHRVEGFGLDTESDVVAIRMPYQEEVLEDGRWQPNDESLVLPEDSTAVDCIIAEVKEPSVEFNKSLRGPEGPQRICAALKMFGVFPREAFRPEGTAAKIADELHTKIRADTWPEYPNGYSSEPRVSVRLIVFAPDTAKHAKERKHIDLQHALDFVNWRMRPGEPCAQYRNPKLPSASPWQGCTRLIVAVLDESRASNGPTLRLEQLIEGVIANGIRSLGQIMALARLVEGFVFAEICDGQTQRIDRDEFVGYVRLENENEIRGVERAL